MTVQMPTWPEPQTAEPFAIDAGGWQEGALEASAVRVDRLGDKHGLRVRMPPMKFDDPAGLAHGRIWIQRLKRGLSEGVRMKFPQPDFSTPPSGTVRTATVAQATLLPVTLGAGLTYREGTFCSIVHAPTGRRYLHSLNSDAVMNGAGQGQLSLWPRLRIPTVVGWDVLFAPPEIEGKLSGREQNWTLDMARTVGLEFEIREVR